MRTKLCLLAALAVGPAARADESPGIRVFLGFTPAAAPVEEVPPVTFSVPRYQLPEEERETVAACLVLEAASQGELGQRGVMAVIRNRARGRPELFARTVLQEKQFSALNKLTSGRESRWRAIQRAKRDPTWPQALGIVDDALRDDWHDPTAGATHYTRTGERTPWTRNLSRTVVIGGHSFYR